MKVESYFLYTDKSLFFFPNRYTIYYYNNNYSLMKSVLY